MNWDQFRNETNFEQLVFELTERSIQLVLTADLPEKRFSAFAFSCFSYDGDISLSFGVDPAYEDSRKKRRLYPPDWEYEVMECSVEEVGALWEARYQPIREQYEANRDTQSDEEFEKFCDGFLVSLRRVMVRLERQGALRGLSDKSIWTLVTETDADTREEERLLQQERKGNA